jgi:hypothetical protein
VPPLLKEIGDYDLNELGSVDFSYRAICCHVIIQKVNGRDLLVYVEQPQEAGDVALELGSPSGRLYISSGIRERIIEYYTRQVISSGATP